MIIFLNNYAIKCITILSLGRIENNPAMLFALGVNAPLLLNQVFAFDLGKLNVYFIVINYER